jgi:hypothetical protein
MRARTAHHWMSVRPSGPPVSQVSTVCDWLHLLHAKQWLRPRVRAQLRRTDAIDRPADSLDHTGRCALSDPIVRRVRERTHALRGPEEATVRHRDAPGITQVQVPNSDHLSRWRRLSFGGEPSAGDTPVSTQQPRDRAPTTTWPDTVRSHGCTLIDDLHTCSCCVFSSRCDSSIPKSTPQH